MLRRFFSTLILILGGLAGPAAAQNFRGPVSGFVFNPASRTIRPLLGIPGAAQVGSPLINDVDFASVGPNGKWGLVTKAGQSYFLLDLAGLAPTELSAEGLIDAVDRVVWNRDGDFALLYSSSTNRLQRVRVSASGVVADAPLDLSSWGPVTTLAIDPAGLRIAFGAAGSGLFYFEAGQSPALLSSISRPVAAAFDGGGRRLYAVDLDQQQILEFESGLTAMTFAPLAQAGAPAIVPVGLAVSGDGRYLVLADGAAQAVLVFDITSRSLADTIALDFVPSRMEALSSAPTFLLNAESNGEWLRVLDAKRFPGVFFVPANREEVR